jgi:hypothetical protein
MVHSTNTHSFILPIADNEILQILLWPRGRGGVHFSCGHLP